MVKKLQILLTNDDGFHADGIQTLYHTLREIAHINIAAPDRERSAVGHGITMFQPLRFNEVPLHNDCHWMIDGTPSDCVKLALDHLLPKRPDLIISGINRGPNLGSDVLYSGTVSAALEGRINQIPSIAASLSGYGKMDFTVAATFIKENLTQLYQLAATTTLNLNFPDLAPDTAYRGVKFTKLGQRLYQNVFEARRDPRNQIYYWMGGELVVSAQDPDSDISAIEQLYVSITPLTTDLTDCQFLKNASWQNQG